MKDAILPDCMIPDGGNGACKAYINQREEIEDLRRQRDEGAERYKCLFDEFNKLYILTGELMTQRDELRSLMDETESHIRNMKFSPSLLHDIQRLLAKIKETT